MLEKARWDVRPIVYSGIALLLFVLGFGVYAASIIYSYVTPEQTNLIEAGMTKAQVVAILGNAHHRNYDGTELCYYRNTNWWGGDCMFLYFDEKGVLEYIR